MTNRILVAGCHAVLTVLLATSAVADVTMKQKLELEAGGMLAMLASEGTLSISISNDRSRMESEMASKSGQTGAGQSMNTVSIDRLDKGLSWQLMPDKQQYSELTFEQKRAQLEEQMQEQGQQASKLPVSAEDCEWSDPKMDVQRTGKKQRIMNIKAEQHIIIVEETCTVPKNSQTCVVTWILDNWMAKRMPGDDEVRKFNSTLATELGIDDMMTRLPASSRGLIAMFEEGWEEAMDEVGELRGYPVKTIMQMEMGGQACLALSGQPIAMDDMWGNALNSGVQAGANTAGYHARWKITQEATQAMGGGVGGSIAGSAVGAASGEVVSGMLRHFSKKKPPEPQPGTDAAAVQGAAAQPNAATESTVLFRLSSELIGIDDNRIPPEQFEVPAGWERVSSSL